MLSSSLILPHEHFWFQILFCSCACSVFPLRFLISFESFQMSYILTIYNITDLSPKQG